MEDTIDAVIQPSYVLLPNAWIILISAFLMNILLQGFYAEKGSCSG